MAVTKGPDAFRTISEAAAEIGVAQHVLRFWETKFSFIRPMKRAGGRRFYRPQDLVVLRGIRRLLHEDGYTIAGVQRLHREHGLARLVEAGGGAPAAAEAPASPPPPRTEAESEGRGRIEIPSIPPGLDLAATLQTLESIKARLDRALGR